MHNKGGRVHDAEPTSKRARVDLPSVSVAPAKPGSISACPQLTERHF